MLTSLRAVIHRVDEFKEQYVQYYQSWQDQYQGQNQYQNYQDFDFFIGPVCTGGKSIEYGIFYNEECTVPVKGTSVKQALGFVPNSNSLKIDQCIRCSNSYGYNNGGQNDELNPLCERMIEESGRCDRDGQINSEFDRFWADVIATVNGQQDGAANEKNYDGYYNAYQQQNQQQQQNQDYYQENMDGEQDQYQNQQQQNYQQNYQQQVQQQNYQQNYYQQNYGNYGGRSLQNNGEMNYYYYQNRNTCDFIDGLPHTTGVWDRVKDVASSKGLGTAELIGVIFAVLVSGVGIILVTMCYCCSGSGSGDDDEDGGYATPYQRELPIAEVEKPSVVVT